MDRAMAIFPSPLFLTLLRYLASFQQASMTLCVYTNGFLKQSPLQPFTTCWQDYSYFKSVGL